MTDLCAECGGGFTAAEWELRHSRTDGEDIHDHCCDCGGDHMTRYEPTPDEIHEIHMEASRDPRDHKPSAWNGPYYQLQAQLLADWLEANPDHDRPFERGDLVDIRDDVASTWRHEGRFALGVTTSDGSIVYETRDGDVFSAYPTPTYIRHHVEGTS